MADSLKDQLRKAINARHAAALKALDEISDYLTTPGTTSNGHEPAKAAKRSAPRKGTGKIRPAVMALLANQFLPVQAVAEQTGYSRGQIRGVILAPSMKAHFAKRVVDGVTEYKYEGAILDTE